MKAIKPQMIKFLLLSVIIVLVTTTTTAQEAPEAQRDTTNTVSHLEFAIGYNIHSVRFACPTLQFRYFVDVTPKIAAGGGFGHEGWLLRNVIGGTTPDFPFHQFQVSAYKFGGALSAMYHFNKGHLELDAYLALYCYNFTAYDSRCEIVIEDAESGPTTTHWFTLKRADGKKWDSNLSYTLTLSYLLPISNRLHLKFAVGYDFTTPIKKELVDEATVLSSNWDEFETYYGQPTINLYEASETVKRVCSIGHFHIGFGFSYFL